MSESEDDELDWSFSDPNTWDAQLWVLLSIFAILCALVISEDGEYKWSAGHQITIGIAIIEVALAIHLAIYPGVLISVIDGITATLATLWSILPTIPWQPWHVTTTMGGLVGPVFIVNGLRGGRE